MRTRIRARVERVAGFVGLAQQGFLCGLDECHFLGEVVNFLGALLGVQAFW
jgi:hypothetical protein